ncbi:Cytochrome P450 3A4 [Termitomyces sp. J132]|nr:Cytochrome P450 3A4 [Termitomyces sp. J132]
MDLLHWSYLLPLPIVVLVYLKARSKLPSISISHIAGPAVSAKGILGNLWEYYHYGVGEFEFRWQEQYGAVYRFKALFGEDRLLVADPKALQYIYRTAGTKWRKPEIRREFGRIYLGRGIAWAQGDDHKRHRKILTPAFGNLENRDMIPSFLENAERLCEKWRRLTTSSETTSAIEVTDGISRATLDTIGIVGFHYPFGALDNEKNSLAQAYKNLLVSTFGLPSKGKIFAQHVLGYLPVGVFSVLEKLPSRSLQGLKNVAIEVKANLSEDPQSRLSEEELSAQMRTIMVAGRKCNLKVFLCFPTPSLADETTGNTIAFLLYELGRHPEAQQRVRSEVMSVLRECAKEGKELAAKHFESMNYTVAVIKEVLRLHPVVYGPFLAPAEDDVLPLSKPIKTLDGKEISALPVGKGQVIHVSISGYNRLRDIWGEYPHDFIPERWIRPTDVNKDGSSSHFGVYANLGNFVSGAQSCLGWKFAVFELQAFVIKIVQAFEWKYPEDGPRVIRATSGVMAPVLEGQETKGKQLVLDFKQLNDLPLVD